MDLSKPEMHPGNHTWNQSSVKLSHPRVVSLHSWLLQNPVAGIKALSLGLHPSCPQASVVAAAFLDWGSSEALALYQWKPFLIFVEVASSHPSFFLEDTTRDDITRAAKWFWGTCTLRTYSQVKWWASFGSLHFLNKSYRSICLLTASECWQIFSENFPQWWQSCFPEQ